MNLRNNSIQNHTNTVAGEELQESPKLGLEKLELDKLDLVSGGSISPEEAEQKRKEEDAESRKNALEMFKHKSMHEQVMMWLR